MSKEGGATLHRLHRLHIVLVNAVQQAYNRCMSADAHILMAMEDVRAAVRQRIDHGTKHVRAEAHRAVERMVDELLEAAPVLRQHPGRRAMVALLRCEADDVLQAA